MSTTPLALLCLAMTACVGAPTSRPHLPNVVLIVVDDLGWSDTSVVFGDAPGPLQARFHTPHLERLAREGVLFSRSYSASPVCTPTRASLMTGIAPHHTGITYWTLRANERTDGPSATLTPPEWNWAGLAVTPGTDHTFVPQTTLPELLRRAGYRTVHAGKWHMGGIGSAGEDPRTFGFDVNIAGAGMGAPGSHRGQDGYGKHLERNHVWDVPGLEEFHGSDVFLTDAITRRALVEVRASAARNQPFFLHLAHYAVHVPFDRDDRFYAELRRAGLDDVEARYAALVAGVDASVGAVLATLDELGIADDTIVLFTSDNGGLAAQARTPPLHVQNAPLRSGKGSPYEGGVRVPTIVRWPGVARDGTRCNTPIVTHDVFATLAAQAGAHARSDGVDLRPLLDGQASAARAEPIVWHFPHTWGPTGPGLEPFSAILDGCWKLVYFHESAGVELYDVERDPGETHDLATREPEVTSRLRTRLRAELETSLVGMPRRRATGELVALP